MPSLRFTLLLVMLMLAGCSGPRVLPDLPAESIELTATPFHPQQRYQCGPAALATVLQSAGVHTTPQALVDQVWIPGRRGSLQLELLAATRSHDRLAYVIDAEFPALLSELEAGRPVLVLLNLGTSWYPIWHFAVVIGFEPGHMLLRSGTTRRLSLPLDRFMQSWGLAESWAMVTLRPGELPARPDRSSYLRAVADLESTGRIAAAAEGYQRWLARHPEDALALFGLANARLALDDSVGAIKAYQRLLEARPGDPAASNNLAQLLLQRGCGSAARDVLAAIAPPIPPAMTDAIEATRRLAADSDAVCTEPNADR